jgi:hypothetical protein
MLNPFSFNSCLSDSIQALTTNQEHPHPAKKPAMKNRRYMRAST